MKEYPTHSWEYVVRSMREYAAANSYFAPMRDAVTQLAASPYASGLHPVLSMHTVRLYQHERASAADEEVRLDFEDGEFVVRHLPGGTPDPRFTINQPAGIWTRRGSNAMALLERALHQLRWFNEYRSVRPADPHGDSAV